MFCFKKAGQIFVNVSLSDPCNTLQPPVNQTWFQVHASILVILENVGSQ